MLLCLSILLPIPMVLGRLHYASCGVAIKDEFAVMDDCKTTLFIREMWTLLSSILPDGPAFSWHGKIQVQDSNHMLFGGRWSSYQLEFILTYLH